MHSGPRSHKSRQPPHAVSDAALSGRPSPSAPLCAVHGSRPGNGHRPGTGDLQQVMTWTGRLGTGGAEGGWDATVHPGAPRSRSRPKPCQHAAASYGTPQRELQPLRLYGSFPPCRFLPGAERTKPFDTSLSHPAPSKGQRVPQQACICKAHTFCGDWVTKAWSLCADLCFQLSVS